MREIYSNINIVGGGLIGLATAFSLSQHDLRITILEKKPKYDPKKSYYDRRTVAISEGTKLFLEKIGLWAQIKKFAEPIKKIKVVDRKPTNFLDFDNERRKSNLGYIVKNKTILDVLHSNLKRKKNIKIFNNINIKNIFNNNEIVEILTNKILIRSDLNIAADGKNSEIRDILKTTIYKKNYNKKAIVINFSHYTNHKNTAYEFFYNNGPLAILPMQTEKENNLSSIVWTNTNEYMDEFIKLDEKYIIKILNDKISNYTGGVKKIYSKQLFALSAHINTKFYKNKTIYIGDAAHSVHPIAGQGWNLGMRDIEKLLQITNRHISLGMEVGSNSFCKEYHNNTFYEAYKLYQITDKLDNIFMQESSILNFVRRTGISIIQNKKNIKNFISDIAMGF